MLHYTYAISGTCCTPSVYVNVIDEESYTDRCHIPLGDPFMIAVVVKEQTMEEVSYSAVKT